MKKRSCIILILILLSAVNLPAQERGVSLAVYPGFDLPMGPEASTGEKLYTYGSSVMLGVDRPFSTESPLFWSGVLDFSMISTEADTGLTLVSAGIGAGIELPVAPRLTAELSSAAGWGFGIYESSSGSNPLGVVRGGASFGFSPAFSLGLNTSYKYLHDIYNGFSFGISAGFSPGAGSGRSNLLIPEVRFDPVFPVFYSWYDVNEMGTAVIQNGENGPIQNVRVSLLVKQYMDSPKLCAVLPAVQRNEEVRVPLVALFTESILSVTEGTKAAAEILVEYEYAGSTREKSESVTLQVYDRNAMTWDDDRKAASFVTSKDPAVLRYSKQVAGETRNTREAVNLNFRIGMGMFQALALSGINYVVDPQTPYADFSRNKTALDYLQFPSQTLTYRAGDCDDLSILYAALLKSVGMEAAFITVPGHIYTAFLLEMSPEEAKHTFQNSGDLIFYEGETWLPVEITMIQEGFLAAWKKGASQWRAAEGERGFFPIAEAWTVYQPVGSPGGDTVDAAPPAAAELKEALEAELALFISDEVEGRAAELRRQIARQNSPAPLINRLGVLYARYGELAKAEAEFVKDSRKLRSGDDQPRKHPFSEAGYVQRPDLVQQGA